MTRFLVYPKIYKAMVSWCNIVFFSNAPYKLGQYYFYSNCCGNNKANSLLDLMFGSFTHHPNVAILDYLQVLACDMLYKLLTNQEVTEAEIFKLKSTMDQYRIVNYKLALPPHIEPSRLIPGNLYYSLFNNPNGSQCILKFLKYNEWGQPVFLPDTREAEEWYMDCIDEETGEIAFWLGDAWFLHVPV